MKGEKMMKARFLLAAAAFACAVLTAEAFDTYKDAFQAARKAGNEKNYDKSQKFLEEAKVLAKNHGQKVQVLDFYADICWYKNELDNAFAKLDEIIGDDESTANQKADALTKKANFLKWKGRKAEAEELYQKAMEQKITGGTKQRVLNGYADLLRLNKKYDEAEKMFQESIAVEKGVPHCVHQTKLGIARVAVDKKDYDKALALYDEIIKTPKIAPWIAGSAYKEIVEKICFPQAKFAEAAEFLDKLEADENISKEQKPWISDFRILLNVYQARALMKEKKYDEAAEKLKAAETFHTQTTWVKQHLAALPASIELGRANEFKTKKQWDDALETYKKALEKSAVNWQKFDALNGIAGILIIQKKLDEAKEYVDKAVNFPNAVPNHQVTALLTLANYNLAKQNVDEAVAALEKASSVTGKVDAGFKACTYSKLAEIYFYRKKDLAKADEYIKKSMAVPDAKWGKNKGLENRIRAALEKQNR